jgi:colanic acid biosynthesis glycosyl transferase WcaI
MKIIIYGINYSPDLVGVGKYTGEMGDWLRKQGHEITVITAPPYYPNWKLNNSFDSIFYKRNKQNGITIWRCPLYVPAKPTAITRVLHLLSFTISSIPIVGINCFFKPDLIIQIAPTIFCAPSTLFFSKITRTKSILHIQDFEVDALFGLNLASNNSSNSAIKNIILMFESWILRKFDLVSTISTGMLNGAKRKGILEDRLILFPNWSEVERFENTNPSPELLENLGVKPNNKVILYSGNMGEKQGLESVILAAESMKNFTDIIFLMVGDGASKSRLMQMAQDLNLSNIVFAPLQEYAELPKLLASANVHLVIQKRGVADAVLPSKLTNILAAGGNVVITADENSTLGQLSIEFPYIAVIVEPESITALVNGIQQALEMEIPNQVAQTYAYQFLDKEKILSNFMKNFES